MTKFNMDLKFGKIYEKKFAELTKKEYEISDGKTYWDVIIKDDDKKLVYEVKTDRRMNKTNNFCIEYEYNKKPSGINKTMADYWVFIEIIDYNFEDMFADYEYNMYIIKTRDLVELIRTCDEKKKMNGGDGYLSKFYLINKKYFEKYKIDKTKQNIHLGNF
jgi:hypothetical protein